MALKAVDKFQHAKQYARACWELILRVSCGLQLPSALIITPPGALQYYLLELPYLGPASIAEGMWVCSSVCSLLMAMTGASSTMCVAHRSRTVAAQRPVRRFY
jgi:hypothetical protein